MATGFTDKKSSTSEEQGRHTVTRLVEPGPLSITGSKNQNIVEFGATLNNTKLY